VTDPRREHKNKGRPEAPLVVATLEQSLRFDIGPAFSLFVHDLDHAGGKDFNMLVQVFYGQFLFSHGGAASDQCDAEWLTDLSLPAIMHGHSRWTRCFKTHSITHRSVFGRCSYAFGGNWKDYINPEQIFARTVLGNPSGQPEILLYGGIGRRDFYRKPCCPNYRELVCFVDKTRGGSIGVWSKNGQMRTFASHTWNWRKTG
jgi:hypothetical protein